MGSLLPKKKKPSMSIYLLFFGLLHVCASSPIVTRQTKLGTVNGLLTTLEDGHTVQQFLGIPYALPPTGRNRWRRPVAITKYNSSILAYSAPPSCPNAATKPSPLCSTCSTRTDNPRFPNDEDCLYLNVMAPADTMTTEDAAGSKLAVVVFVHGGAGYMGTASPYSNSSSLVSKGVILVSMNYRLGILGWLPHAEDGGSANYAVSDVIAALEWVRENIEFFGGDSKRVTIFGQSFGGSMIHYLLLAPEAKGLFHAAIAHSGDLDFTFDSQENAEEVVGTALLRGLGCEDIACARAASWETVLDVANVPQVVPVVHKRGVFPANPPDMLLAGTINAVPLISGHNEFEGRLSDYFSTNSFDHFYSMYANNHTLRDSTIEKSLKNAPGTCKHSSSASKAAARDAIDNLYHGMTEYDQVSSVRSDSVEGIASWSWCYHWRRLGIPSYRYVFTASAQSSTQLGPFGATHLLDLTYVFNDTRLLAPRAMTASELELSEAMAAFWTSFAQTLGAIPPRDEHKQTEWVLFDEKGQSNIIENGGNLKHEQWRHKQTEFFAKWENSTLSY